MEDTINSAKFNQVATTPETRFGSHLFAGKEGRKLREALLAYAFLFPTIIIIGTFGLFPLMFAAYESTLRGLNKIVGKYDGLSNYVRAMDSLAYVLAFWVTAALIFFAVRSLIQTRQNAIEKKQSFWAWLIPGISTGAGIALFCVFIFRLLPELLLIPGKMRGKSNTSEIFRQLAGEAWRLPNVQQAFWGAILVLLISAILAYFVRKFTISRNHTGNAMGAFVAATIMLAVAALLGWLTWTEINNAYAEALEAGEGLELWSQIITISAGFLLLLIAWWLWESASFRASTASTVFRLVSAAMLMLGAWFLIGELPRAIAAGDEDWWRGLQATVYYSMGTIPAQLSIALLLAALLFQNLKGKSFFRIVYFIPYVAPFVGTAAVFRIIFSGRTNAPMNSLLSGIGANPLQWLNDPTGLFQLILGSGVTLPGWAVGPSLALIVIMIYGTWTFIGFNTVIFMAGLGNIPTSLYEAASIDGASRWAQFRNITLPLLSPTIYFLTLYSVIGTFKAFNHIYVLRQAAALGTTDTASVVIFQAFNRDTRYGYASALAILLLLIILVITAINNRIASKRVFYG
ncbi:sugar ABC transporter permease [Chloroflexi bacterium TSY]|nr:sugar ABC transporter permease [Chloroflexi bacterium TSY]